MQEIFDLPEKVPYLRPRQGSQREYNTDALKAPCEWRGVFRHCFFKRDLHRLWKILYSVRWCFHPYSSLGPQGQLRQVLSPPDRRKGTESLCQRAGSILCTNILLPLQTPPMAIFLLSSVSCLHRGQNFVWTRRGNAYMYYMVDTRRWIFRLDDSLPDFVA